jgi:hypothetical protein
MRFTCIILVASTEEKRREDAGVGGRMIVKWM